MTILEAIEQRHSVRSYREEALSEEIKRKLQEEIGECNRESGLRIQLVTDEPQAFDGFLSHYGKFSGVQNYIALIGSRAPDLEERAGYFGERLALYAQTLGLNTCWVAMSFKKGAAKAHCRIAQGEKLVCVLALGYGSAQGAPRKSKTLSQVCADSGELPDWYRQGIRLALLAPTAVNQQKFLFCRENDTVSLRSTGGFYSQIDLGIVKYHFEIGAGAHRFSWKS